MYERLCHRDKIVELRKSLYSQQGFFQKVTTWSDSILKACYVAVYLIAKKNQDNLLAVRLLSNV